MSKSSTLTLPGSQRVSCLTEGQEAWAAAQGQTVAEQADNLQQHHDSLRRFLLNEPRGHGDMFGALVVPPSQSQRAVDFGIVFTQGYLKMCGHGSIGTVTALARMGHLRQGQDDVVLDTPAGLVHAHAQWQDASHGRMNERTNGRTSVEYRWCAQHASSGPYMSFDGAQNTAAQCQVTIRNVPACYLGSTTWRDPVTARLVRVELAYGGNAFALVQASDIGVDLLSDVGAVLDSARLQRLSSVGVELREFVNSEQGVALFHLVSKHRLPILLVEFYEPDPASNDGTQSGRKWDQRSVVVFGQGQVDRSPCGTGTCATMVMLCHQRRLQLGHTHHVCGVVGTVFEGTLVE